MTRHHKRWACWGTALFLSAIYFVAAMLHWTHVWQTFPVAVSAFYVVAAIVLVLAGWLAETEVIRIRNDAAALAPAHVGHPMSRVVSGRAPVATMSAQDTVRIVRPAVPVMDAPADTSPVPMFSNVVSMPNPKVYQLGILEGERRAQRKAPEMPPE